MFEIKVIFKIIGTKFKNQPREVQFILATLEAGMDFTEAIKPEASYVHE